MDPVTLLLIASLLGAASFFAAGYFAARREPMLDVEADVPATSARESTPEVPRMAPVTNLQAWVEEIARQSESRSVALFDDEGLTLAGTDPAELRLGALAGQVARLSREQGAYASVGARAVFSVADETGALARFRCFRHGRQRLLLMTRGAGPHVAQVEEDAIAAVDRLLRAA